MFGTSKLPNISWGISLPSCKCYSNFHILFLYLWKICSQNGLFLQSWGTQFPLRPSTWLAGEGGREGSQQGLTTRTTKDFFPDFSKSTSFILGTDSASATRFQRALNHYPTLILSKLCSYVHQNGFSAHCGSTFPNSLQLAECLLHNCLALLKIVSCHWVLNYEFPNYFYGKIFLK